MSSVRKRGKTWTAQVRIAGWRSFTKTFNKKTDAIVWSKTLEDKIKSVPIPDNNIENLKLKDLLKRYSNEISPKLKGFEREVYKINLIIRSWLGEIPVINLNKHHINQYRDDRLKEVKSGTVRSDLMLIKRVIKTSISQWGYGLPNNPMDSVVMPSPHKPRSRRVSEEELELLLQYAKSNRNIFIAPIIEFAIETGMRRSEILKLKWENIDNGIASLYDTKNGEDRYIPLTRHAQGVLKMLSKVSHYVFPITADCLKSAWNRIKQKSNIKDLRFHDLRHESVSRFFEMGLSIPEVALISGHKDVRQLFRYTHLKAENLREKYKEVF